MLPLIVKKEKEKGGILALRRRSICVCWYSIKNQDAYDFSNESREIIKGGLCGIFGQCNRCFYRTESIA